MTNDIFEMNKILLCHNYYQYPGGESLVFENEIQGLKQNGHEVILNTLRNESIGQYSRGQKTKLVFSAYGLSRVNYKLRELIEREKPDVALVQNVFPLLSPSLYTTLAASQVPIIQAVYNYRFVCPSAELYTQGAICERCMSGNTTHAVFHRCYRNSYLQSAWYASIIGYHRVINTFNRCIACFMVPDEFLGKKLIRGGINANKIECNPNPFFVQHDVSNPTHQANVLYVGRLIRQKGVLTLIEAMKYTDSQSRLTIVGQGELSAIILDKIKRFGLESKVILLEPLWGKEIEDLIKECAAVIIPSEWYDNLPQILCQANALARPVIASNIDGIPEYIRDGYNGFLFEPGNAIQLARLIDRICQMPDDEFSLMSQNSRTFAENVFDYPNHYHKLMSIIQNITGA